MKIGKIHPCWPFWSCAVVDCRLRGKDCLFFPLLLIDVFVLLINGGIQGGWVEAFSVCTGVKSFLGRCNGEFQVHFSSVSF